jgi:protease I
MTTNLTGLRVAFLIADGVDQSELTGPWRALRAAGAEPFVVSPSPRSVQSTATGDIGSDIRRDTYGVDTRVDEADAAGFDALVIPGGVLSADTLRADAASVAFAQAFALAQKPVAAICHAPWLLIEAGIAEGREVTSFPSLRTDLENAGALWSTDMIVVDDFLITSRRADAGFTDRLIALIGERRRSLVGA